MNSGQAASATSRAPTDDIERKSATRNEKIQVLSVFLLHGMIGSEVEGAPKEKRGLAGAGQRSTGERSTPS